MRTPDFAQTLGLQLGLLVAGFAGGVVSTLFATNLTRTQAVSSVLCSVFVAGYATPVAIHYFDITDDAYRFGTAFLIGLFTMSLVPAVKAIGNRWLQQKEQGLILPNPPSGEEPKP